MTLQRFLGNTKDSVDNDRAAKYNNNVLKLQYPEVQDLNLSKRNIW